MQLRFKPVSHRAYFAVKYFLLCSCIRRERFTQPKFLSWSDSFSETCSSWRWLPRI